MNKKISLIMTALWLTACAAEPAPQSPFSLLAPKQLNYRGQTFELAQSERQNLVYGSLTYADKSNNQLHYLLSSMIMPLDKLEETLKRSAKEKNYSFESKIADRKLYSLTEQTVDNTTYYKQSVSENSDCGTLTVIKNSSKPTALFDTALGETLDQMKCQKNHQE